MENGRHQGANNAPNARGNASAEQELASKTLQIQNKRFYLDVKENNRGKFIKIAEVGVGGRKSRILMPMPTAAEFRDKLNSLNDVYSALQPHNAEELAADGRIKSDSIIRDSRRYYLDLKENQRGRFLRVTMMSPSSRSQVAIPAQGMIELRNALTELLNEYGAEEEKEGSATDLPDSKSLRVESKMFYFDVGSNRRGVFLRISEVRTNYRTAVTIPEKSWGKFRDIVNEFADKLSLKESSGKGEVAAEKAQGDSAAAEEEE